MFSHRPSLPADFCAFDISFAPMFNGKNGKRVSAEYLIQQRLCQDALAGKRKAVTAILRHAEAQEAERTAKQDAKRKLPMASECVTRPDRERRATYALLLLSITSYDVTIGDIWLEPWAADLALSRDGVRMLTEAEASRLTEYTRPDHAPAPDIYRSPIAEARQPRSPAATQFKKGQSGNPKGRPKKTKHDLPLSNYLDEVGTVTVAGKTLRMTRMQYVLHVLNTKAIQGDPCMTAVLACRYMSQRLKRFSRGDDSPATVVMYQGTAYHEWNLPDRIAADPFERMLRLIRITSPRAKTRVLLEPWVVEAALARFGDRQLTKEEQAEVLISTSKPATVAWPAWWVIRSHVDAKPYRPMKPRFRSTVEHVLRY